MEQSATAVLPRAPMLVMKYTDTTTPKKAENVLISVETSTLQQDRSNLSGSLSPICSVGRVKEAPKCDDPTFRAEAMSTEELAKFVFPPGLPFMAPLVANTTTDTGLTFEISCSSCSSSSSSREMEGVDEVVMTNNQKCTNINAKLLSRQTSRQGRETQRWATDDRNQQVVRLVTGCVPILRNGKILFISASRKPEWILPKGGWEDDETMEESAVRECYEEAGVFGTLGPRLAEIEYETRKSKKRKADLEDMLRMKEKYESRIESYSENLAEHQPSIASGICITPVEVCFENKAEKTESHVSFSCDTPIMMSDAAVARIRESAAKKSDETSSITSDASTYSHVRMTLFPLYVSEVVKSWPESGRFRKAVDIDEAIKMLEKRPEFHAFLSEVKSRGLHLVPQRNETMHE